MLTGALASTWDHRAQRERQQNPMAAQACHNVGCCMDVASGVPNKRDGCGTRECRTMGNRVGPSRCRRHVVVQPLARPRPVASLCRKVLSMFATCGVPCSCTPTICEQ